MDYDFIDDELKAKIQETKFVFLVARAGTGKTFSGDYLEGIRGWKHVDGDIPLKNTGTHPEWKDPVENFWKGAFEGNPDLCKPFYEIVARLTLEAARDADNEVVVSHATYSKELRVYFRQLLVDAGAKDVSTVFLYTEPDNHAEALWNRTKRQSEDSGIPFEDVVKIWQYTGVVELESWKTWFREESSVYAGFDEPEDLDQPYAVVNNTAKDVTVLDRLDEVLGIDKNTSRGDGTYDEMIEKIKAVDAKRDEAMYEDWNEALEKEDTEDAKAELELAKSDPKKLAARRSSLLDIQKMGSTRSMSSRSSKASSRSSLITGSRRSSFIILGKLEGFEEVDEE